MDVSTLAVGLPWFALAQSNRFASRSQTTMTPTSFAGLAQIVTRSRKRDGWRASLSSVHITARRAIRPAGLSFTLA
jgi:hypothetical protein